MAEIEARWQHLPKGSTASGSGSRCTSGLSPMPHSR
jgi:hypothetical protein